jgi:hypothetical protein
LNASSLDVLGSHNVPWTAQHALDLLPENSGPKIEVVRGSVIVTPQDEFDHQTVLLEICYRLKAPTGRLGLWVYPKCNVVSGDDLFVPDVAVLLRSGGGRTHMPVSDAVLLGEIAFRAAGRTDVVDRRREYAAAGVPFYLQVNWRDRQPVLVLHELRDGAFQPVAAAQAGGTFAMRSPFEFSVDQGDLMDRDADERPRAGVREDG